MNRRGRNCFLEKSVLSEVRCDGDLVEGFEKLLCAKGRSAWTFSEPSLEMSRLNRVSKARVVKLVPNKKPVVHKSYNFKMHRRKRL
jgi:hypothetical protein